MKIYDILLILLFIIALFVLLPSEKQNFIPDTPEKVERLVMAIYKAEGGAKTNYPFGIKSVKCSGYENCKRICENTVRNNVKRWKNAQENGDTRDYITFLWHRYCPPHGRNRTRAEKKLNNNWKKNVLYFLNKKEK